MERSYRTKGGVNLKSKNEAPKLAHCIGNVYNVTLRGEELHEIIVFTAELTEVTHIGIPVLVFDEGNYVVNANRLCFMEVVE